jgi:hypothetical protein
MEAEQVDVTNGLDVGGSVYIGGSLHVHGSVVGSGPYMDSSDKSFKMNIKPITLALDKVLQLQGVSRCLLHVNTTIIYLNKLLALDSRSLCSYDHRSATTWIRPHFQSAISLKNGK